MSNIKFTELPTVSAATLADIICGVQSATSSQETLQQVFALMLSNTILNNAGNPNGAVAGVTYQLCFDTTHSILYICTTSGSTSTAVWTTAAALLVPVTLAEGGTSASLTANNGGIFYSTASAGAILAGTATADQVLLSGSSTAPAWSTATYPATTTVSQLLYSSSSNVIAGLATGNNGALITGAGGIPSISSTLPATVQGNITQLGAQAQALNMNSHLINNVSNPVSAQDAATKQYVDAIALGGGQPVDVATTGPLNATYVNGVSGVGATLTDASGTFAAFSVDGQSPSVGDRVLVKNQSSTFQNGVYILTTNGDTISIPWVLTRASDYDTVSDINDTGLIPVELGTANANTAWYNTTTMVAVGTTAVTFVRFGNLNAINKVTSQTFTSTNTYTPTTGCLYVSIQACGGGGGGGACVQSSSSQAASGAGGGGAEYRQGIFPIATVIGAGSTAAITIGGGGAGGSAGANNGVAGANTTVVANAGGGATIMQANGGSGGVAGADTAQVGFLTASGGAGGTGGSGGDFAVRGTDGDIEKWFGGTAGASIGGAWGGNCFFGSGTGAASGIGAGGGTAATGQGGGGSGGASINNSAAAGGGNGTHGIVYITEYCSI